MIIYQSRIYRIDLEKNPSLTYVFGDNVQRIGMGGQAREMRGEPNAVGVATKWSSYEFFDVARTVEQNAIIDADMAPLFRIAKGGGTIVLPTDGLGTGLAELQTRAPATFDHLLRRMVELAESAA
jgi:hypothetical protein